MSAHVETEDESMVQRNMLLASVFAQEVIAQPSLMEHITNGVTLVLIPRNDPALAEFNRNLGREAELAGKTVIYREVEVSAAPGRYFQGSA